MGSADQMQILLWDQLIRDIPEGCADRLSSDPERRVEPSSDQDNAFTQLQSISTGVSAELVSPAECNAHPL